MAEKLASDRQLSGDGDPSGLSGSDSIGALLIAARERRGLQAIEAASAAGVPRHYVEMLEKNDYELIPDALYLVPFLRRYASFLHLDSDGLAIQFVREAQRAETGIGKTVEPTARAGRRRAWIASAVVTILVLLALYAALGGLRRARQAPQPSAEVEPLNTPVEALPSPATEGTPGALPEAPAVQPSVAAVVPPGPAPAPSSAASAATGGTQPNRSAVVPLSPPTAEPPAAPSAADQDMEQD